jgi:hypothetical protein
MPRKELRLASVEMEGDGSAGERLDAPGNVPAPRLTLHFSETLRSGGELAADCLMDLLERVLVGVLLPGIEGFGAHHHLHTERLEWMAPSMVAASARGSSHGTARVR